MVAFPFALIVTVQPGGAWAVSEYVSDKEVWNTGLTMTGVFWLVVTVDGFADKRSALALAPVSVTPSLVPFPMTEMEPVNPSSATPLPRSRAVPPTVTVPEPCPSSTLAPVSVMDAEPAKFGEAVAPMPFSVTDGAAIV